MSRQVGKKHAGKTHIKKRTIWPQINVGMELKYRVSYFQLDLFRRCGVGGVVIMIALDHALNAAYIASYQYVTHLWIKERIRLNNDSNIPKYVILTCCNTTVLQKHVVLQFVPENLRSKMSMFKI